MVHQVTVVGSGPNGLSAGLALARAGCRVTVLEAGDQVGGGVRSHQPFTDSSAVVDHCAAVHPMAIGSPALAGLEHYGLRWAWPDIDCAHPLPGESSALLYRSVKQTADRLGRDRSAWRVMFEANARNYPDFRDDMMSPPLHVPRRPVRMARFGAPTPLPAAVLGRAFRTPQARALFLGTAAHAMRPLTEVFSAAIGLGLLTAGHHNGWAVARGGSSSIATALRDALLDHGATLHTGVRVTSTADLPPADATVFDTSPGDVTAIMGGPSAHLPAARRYRSFVHGPAVFKVDIAIRGPVSWSDPALASAGTVHVGGHGEQIVAAEAAVADGRLPDELFVLVAQQFAADPSRVDGDIVPLYAYAHVPRDLETDITDAVIDRIAEFAPGLRERIVETITTTPHDFAIQNSNFVSGDILCGASSPRQLLFGPRHGRNPYRTGLAGVYLCSAATPPGPGAHGMSGYNAAQCVLRDLRTM